MTSVGRHDSYRTRYAQLKKSQPHKLHIWFFANTKKPKEQFLTNALKKNR